jgi:chorismate mutase
VVLVAIRGATQVEVNVPLPSTVALAVPGALPKVVRLPAYAEAGRPRSGVEHVYPHGASALRPDLTRAARP